MSQGKLIHEDLTWTVKGLLFRVHTQLGPGQSEELCEQAIAVGLTKLQISFETQKAFEVYYEGVRVGLYLCDVYIQGGQLILELKSGDEITPLHVAQMISYL